MRINSLGLHPERPFIVNSKDPDDRSQSDSLTLLHAPNRAQFIPEKDWTIFFECLENKALIRQLCDEVGVFKQPQWLSLAWVGFKGANSIVFEDQSTDQGKMTFVNTLLDFPSKIDVGIIKEIFFDPTAPDKIHSFYLKPAVVGGGGNHVVKVSLNFASNEILLESNSLHMASKLEEVQKGVLDSFIKNSNIQLRRNFSDQFDFNKFLDTVLHFVPSPILEQVIPHSLTSQGHRAEARFMFHDPSMSCNHTFTASYMKISSNKIAANLASGGGYGGDTKIVLQDMIKHNCPDLDRKTIVGLADSAVKDACDNAGILVGHVTKRILDQVTGIDLNIIPQRFANNLPKWCVDIVPHVQPNGSVEWYLVEMQSLFNFSGLLDVSQAEYDACESIDNACSKSRRKNS